MKRYKFLREGFKSEYGRGKWTIDKWRKHKGALDMCNAGFHCSRGVGQAFGLFQVIAIYHPDLQDVCDGEQQIQHALSHYRDDGYVNVWAASRSCWDY